MSRVSVVIHREDMVAVDSFGLLSSLSQPLTIFLSFLVSGYFTFLFF